MFKAFNLFTFHFLELRKEPEKTAKSVIFFVNNFLSINPFAFTFKRSFYEKPLLKTTLRHVGTSCVYPETVLW